MVGAPSSVIRPSAMHTRAIAVVLTVAAAACGDDTPTYHRDVRPIVEGRCVSCHADGAIAPFALDSYDAVAALAAPVRHAVSTRQMPPWSASPSVDYRWDISLTDAQIETIVAWVDAGAPEGDPGDVGEPLPEVQPTFPSVDLELPLPEPYTPVDVPDEYRCFPLAWTETTEKYVTALNIVPGNLEIVHHVAVFLLPPNNADKPYAWDAEDDRPGYECFGGPSGGRDAIPIVQLGAWLPGQTGNVYPNDIGIRVQPGSTLVLQIHYNVTSPDPAPDQSRIQFALANAVAKEAWYAPFLNPSWVVGAMEIPAGEPEVVHAHREDPRTFFDLVAGRPLPLEDGFDVHAVMFHMHDLGVRGAIARNERGLKTPILELDSWDFNWQRQYVLQDPIAVEGGVELDLECVFDNSPANQPRAGAPVDVNWGEGTSDEMCVANLLITAR